eukprot:2649181-Amphidinium_carterae.2
MISSGFQGFNITCVFVMLDALAHGLGAFKHANGNTYMGEWCENIAQGKAVYSQFDGTVYEGSLKRETQGFARCTQRIAVAHGNGASLSVLKWKSLGSLVVFTTSLVLGGYAVKGE